MALEPPPCKLGHQPGRQGPPRPARRAGDAGV